MLEISQPILITALFGSLITLPLVLQDRSIIDVYLRLGLEVLWALIIAYIAPAEQTVFVCWVMAGAYAREAIPQIVSWVNHISYKSKRNRGCIKKRGMVTR